MNMQDAAAAAIAGHQGATPGPQGAPPNAGGGQDGSLRQLAEAYGRCEQTHQCTPQDRAILQSGLPKLVQMAKNIQQILQTPNPGQPPQQPGQQPQLSQGGAGGGY